MRRRAIIRSRTEPAAQVAAVSFPAEEKPVVIADEPQPEPEAEQAPKRKSKSGKTNPKMRRANNCPKCGAPGKGFFFHIRNCKGGA